MAENSEPTKLPTVDFCWVKPGNLESLVFIGKEAIGFFSNWYIIIYDTRLKRKLIYTANTNETGEGVQTLAGCRSSDLFVFSDKSVKSRIFVIRYPSFQICSILEETETGDEMDELVGISYVTLAISDTEFVVSLTGIPKFEITLWSWRNAQKLATVPSDLQIVNQSLWFSPIQPNVIVELAVKKGSNLMRFWEILYCKKQHMLIKHIPQGCRDIIISNFCFSPEGHYYVLDKSGNVYFVPRDTFTFQPMVLIDTDTTNPTNVVSYASEEMPYNIHWFRGGIATICTKHDYIQHYKRSQELEWGESYRIQLTAPAFFSHTNYSRECILLLNEKDELVRVNSKNDVTVLFFYGSKFKIVRYLQPEERFFVTCHDLYACIWECEGAFKYQVFYEGSSKALSMDCHPYKSLFAVGLDNGTVLFFRALKPNYEPIRVGSIYLCNDPMDNIHFVRNGSSFVSISFEKGVAFVFKGFYGENTKVMATKIFSRTILRVKYGYGESPSNPDIIVLFKTDPSNPFGGKELVFYNMGLNITKNIELETNIVDYEPRGGDHFYIILQGSYQMFSLVYNFKKKKVKRFDNYASGHEVRKFNMFADQYHYYTFGWDGVLVSYSVLTENVTARFEALHCLNQGIKFACLDYSGRYVAVIGRDWTFAFYKVNLTENVGPKIKMRRISLEMGLEDHDNDDDFSLPAVTKFPIEAQYKKITYVKYEEEVAKLVESKKYEGEISSIRQMFNKVKKQLVRKLDENLMLPEEDQMDIAEFDLDSDMEELKLQAAQKECDEMQAHYEKIIRESDMMSARIIKHCWDTMAKKSRIVKALDGNFEVQSYGLLPENKMAEYGGISEWVKYRMMARDTFASKWGDDRLLLWQPVEEKETDEERQMREENEEENASDVPVLLKPTVVKKSSVVTDSALASRRKHEYSGSSSYKYIEVPSEMQNQLYFNSRLHTVFFNILFEKVEIDLQIYFNHKFDEMFKRKEFEMYSLIQRNNRIRVILYEMAESCKRPSDEIPPTDPQWVLNEIPERMVSVEDSEVKAIPYVSPSEQALIDARLAEEERIRLLLAADTFREQALMDMMDGVLEVRWEDILKKEIPLPECTFEKQPENYNEQDLIAIRNYEEEVKNLIAERERYYKMLEQELKKTKISIEDSIKKFDNDLYDLLLLKLDVESSVNHEMLKQLRHRQRVYKLYRFEQEERDIKQTAKQKEMDANATVVLMERIRESYRECKSNYDALVAKDKRFERQLKVELHHNAVPVSNIENYVKIFKRRPKIIQRNPPSIILYEDIARCVIANDQELIKSLQLPQEFIDFFNSLQNYDTNNVVPNLDENLWNIIVSARRKKIESEFKIRAAQLALSETDKMLQKITKDITSRESRAFSVEIPKEKLYALRNKKWNYECDFEIQLIMKEGQVEALATGGRDDFKDCLLVNRVDVEYVNKLVMEAGAKKIEAMVACAEFHRGILLHEWEHKKLNMEIEDLNHLLHNVKNIKLTNEIKQYIRFVQKHGEPTQKDLNELEKESNTAKLLQHYHKKALREITQQTRVFKRKSNIVTRDNRTIDKKIEKMNCEVSTIHHYRSAKFEKHEKEDDQRRMDVVVNRSKLVNRIQQIHCEILQLQTELELLRLKTYPTLKYKSLI